MIQRIFHLNICVSDLDRSLDFYCGTLGMKLQEGHPFHIEGDDLRFGFGMPQFEVVRCRGAFVRFGEEETATAIDLLEFIEPKPAGPPYPSLHYLGIARTAFKVRGDFDAVYESLKSKGIEFMSEPVEAVLAGTRVRWACFPDPDGTILEIFSDEVG